MSRFVFVQPHLRHGGAERQTVIVANALVERGHEVHVVLHSGGGGLLPLVDDDVHVHVLGVESHFASPEVARRLHRVLRALPPAFVVVKLWSSILACALVDRRRTLAHHVFNYCEDLDPADHAEYIPLGRLKQRIVGRVFRSRPFLSANTRTVAERMVDVYGLGGTPAVIPSTIDAAAITAACSPPERPPVFTVVSVGSLIHRKGLDTTLAALESLERPVHWRIVGSGPLAPQFAAHRDPRGLLTISVEGAHAEPYSLMAGADVLVHSARSEAWGIVILEALAVGTPVIAADAIGPREMQETLGERPELFELFPVDSRDALRDRLLDRMGRGRPRLHETTAYVAPMSVDRAVEMWEVRAATAAGGVR